MNVHAVASCQVVGKQFAYCKLKRCRKAYLHLACGGNQLSGIGGPSAPHVFAFDKRKDLEGTMGEKHIEIFCSQSRTRIQSECGFELLLSSGPTPR